MTASHLAGRSPHRGTDRVRLFAAAAPVYLFAISCWIASPTSIGGNITISFLIPLSFCLAFFVVDMRRGDFLHLAHRLKFEFVLLLALISLALLSLLNSNEPFRAFRILFPCALPFLLFAQLAALRTISPRAVAALPRFFVLCAIAFSTVPLLISMAYPPLAPNLFVTHRLIGFFENPNQHAIALGTLIPIAIAEFSVAGTRRSKILWFLVFFALLYTLLRTGSKTALLVSLASGWAFFTIIHLRKSGALQRISMTFGMLFLAAFIAMFGIRIAGMIDPILAEKLEMIFSGGVGNYYSVQSRQELWREAIELGSRHWMIGAGAGEMILGVPHAHNLILDYFRGVGLFGAVAVLLLCLTILYRAARKALAVLSKDAGPGDIRIFACYVSAAIYVICNQLSDSFGPTTIASLWVIYIAAVFSEHCANQLAQTAPAPRPARSRPQLRHHLPPRPQPSPRHPSPSSAPQFS